MNNIFLCLIVILVSCKTPIFQEQYNLKSVELELSNVYDNVLSEYKEDGTFVSNLIIS
jgi:hypothetical protein